jgi:hypothetical protein
MNYSSKFMVCILFFLFLANDDDDDSNGDYADVLSTDYHIDRKQIHMIESLGNGQFGEVYRGILKVKKKQSNKLIYILILDLD